MAETAATLASDPVKILAEVGKHATEHGKGPLTMLKELGLGKAVQSIFAQGGFSPFLMVGNAYAAMLIPKVFNKIVDWVKNKSNKDGPYKADPYEEQPFADYAVPAVVGDVAARDLADANNTDLDAAVDEIVRSSLRGSPEHVEYVRGRRS